MNSSETAFPKYEGDPETIFLGLFDYFDDWQTALEAGDDVEAGNVAYIMRSYIRFIEGQSLPVPQDLASRYETVKRMIGNPGRRPARTRRAYNPWAVCRAMQKKHGWSEAKYER